MGSAIIVLGVARSATTWLAETTAAATDGFYVDEPDGHAKHPRGLVAKLGSGIFPTGDRFDGPLADYWRDLTSPPGPTAGWTRTGRSLWRSLSGESRDRLVLGRRPMAGLTPLARSVLGRLPLPTAGGPTDRPLVIKSVHACLYADRLADAVDARFVVTDRRLPEVAASWLRLDYYPFEPDRVDRVVAAAAGWGIDVPPWPDGLIERTVWSVGVQQAVLAEIARRRDWPVFNHGAAVEDRAGEFTRVFTALDIPTDRLDELLAAGDQQGDTYRPQRTREQLAGWADKLEPATRERLEAAVRQFNQVLDDQG